MIVDIRDFSISDQPIVDMFFDVQFQRLQINTESSYRISDKRLLGRTIIVIENWEEIQIEKYISNGPMESGKTFQLELNSEIPTMDMIQEMKYEMDSTLILSGFVKEGNGWLTYKIKNPVINVASEKA